MTEQTHFNLQENEAVVWHGKAEWEQATKPRPRIVTAFVYFLLALLCALISSLLLAGDNVEANSWLRSLFAILLIPGMVLVIISWGKFILYCYKILEKSPDRQPATYLLTDQRLIVQSGTPPTIETVMCDVTLGRVSMHPNGAVHNVELWFLHDSWKEDVMYDPQIFLPAVQDASTFKRHLIEVFGTP